MPFNLDMFQVKTNETTKNGVNTHGILLVIRKHVVLIGLC